MPVTKYRGHPNVPDTIFEVSHATSAIATENDPSVYQGVDGQTSALTGSAFLDEHSGFAFLAMSVGGTNVQTGDVVSVLLTPGNGGTPVTASYTATSGDSGQATVALRQQAVATGLVAAINASLAVTGGSAFLSTVSAPVNAAFTLVAKASNGSVTINNNAATTSTPGTATHAVLSPTGATNPFVPQNTNLHLPTADANFIFTPYPGAPGAYIALTGSEPILLDPLCFAAALAAGVSFSY